MKKAILIVAALILGFQAYAQETVTPAGNITIDLNFDPAAIFDAGAGSMFYFPYVKARFFNSSNTAFRIGLGVDLESDKEYMDADGEDFVKTSSTDILIAPGYEKQVGQDRFRFYYGADLPISFYTTKSVSEFGGNTIEAKNPDGGYFSIGVDAILGIDFYLLPNFYIGAELSPGFYFVNYSDTEVDGTVTEAGGTGAGFDLASGSGVRVGVRF